jgi:glucokinase
VTDSARIVGLDFGGTSIKGGAADPSGSVIEERSIPIALEGGAEDVLDRAANLARELFADTTPTALGVGIAGLIDRARGVLLESPNLVALNGVNLIAGLAQRLGLEPASVRLENDANVAALGEQWLGAGRGEEHLMVVTLGTGIGGGLVQDGHLTVGPNGNAGEIGHVVVDPSGPQCGCGSLGCLETLASATAARRRAEELGLPAEDPGNLELLSERARAAVGPERDLLHAVGRDLGLGLAYPVVLLDLECFVFAGGFAAAFDVLEPGIREGLAQRSFGRRELRLRHAELGSSAGWIGAARLVLEPH